VVTTLTTAPALGPLLARGALRSPFKRPRPGVGFRGDRLVLPGLHVDLGLLAAYERVCGFPTGEASLPVTYPHVLGFPLAMSIMSGRDFPLPLLGLVHTSIEITRHRALAATGTYALTVHVDRLAPHRRGTEAYVVTELRGEDAEVVWQSTSTYLARHRTDPPTATERPEPAAAEPSGPGPAEPDRAVSTDFFGTRNNQPPRAGSTEPPGTRSTDFFGTRSNQPPGTRNTRPPGASGTRPSWADRGEFPPVSADGPPGMAGMAGMPGVPLPLLDKWQLAADIGRRYGAASGDRNPIHLHALTARLFGFPRAIAHGMWTVARCLAAHGTPQAVRVRAEFRAPVLLPGTVLFAADGRRFELRGPGEAGRVHVSGRVDPVFA
jgi:acyl dehydratase